MVKDSQMKPTSLLLTIPLLLASLMLVIVGLLSLAAAFVLNLLFKARPAREAAQGRPQSEDAAPAVVNGHVSLLPHAPRRRPVPRRPRSAPGGDARRGTGGTR